MLTEVAYDVFAIETFKVTKKQTKKFGTDKIVYECNTPVVLPLFLPHTLS